MRLTAEGKTYTAPLELKVDARVKDIKQGCCKSRLSLERKIVAEVSEIHETDRRRCGKSVRRLAR